MKNNCISDYVLDELEVEMTPFSKFLSKGNGILPPKKLKPYFVIGNFGSNAKIKAYNKQDET